VKTKRWWIVFVSDFKYENNSNKNYGILLFKWPTSAKALVGGVEPTTGDQSSYFIT
jgi:hypothetical protein